MRQRLVFLIVMVLFAGFFAVGGFMTYRDQRNGTPATATITDCTERLAKYGGDICHGRWVVGDPVFGDGRFVTGTVEGATSGDEGKKIDVVVNGDRATVPGMRLSIVLWSMAGIILALSIYSVVKEQRPAAASP